MKENKYDDPQFFEQYSKMERSQRGLEGAGEWYRLREMMPDLAGKRVLDLGCGFGWHCRYAAERGALQVTGVDISEKMLAEARAKTESPVVDYIRCAIEDIDFPPGSYDVVISSLAFHYLASFRDICQTVRRILAPGGAFVFSVEHPIFTAEGSQQWVCDGEGSPLYWPMDRYFDESVRTAVFLGEKVTKYHRTIETYVGDLLAEGFSLTGLSEPQPDPRLLMEQDGPSGETRRPMFLLLSAVRQ